MKHMLALFTLLIVCGGKIVNAQQSCCLSKLKQIIICTDLITKNTPHFISSRVQQN